MYKNSVGLELKKTSLAETYGMSCVKTPGSAARGRE